MLSYATLFTALQPVRREDGAPAALHMVCCLSIVILLQCRRTAFRIVLLRTGLVYASEGRDARVFIQASVVIGEKPILFVWCYSWLRW